MDVDSVVVLRMENVILGTNKDVYSAYLPPYDSNNWKVTQHGYHMELIEKSYGPAWCNRRFLKKALLGTDKGVMFISAYLPPYDSNYGPAWCN